MPCQSRSVSVRQYNVSVSVFRCFRHFWLFWNRKTTTEIRQFRSNNVSLKNMSRLFAERSLPINEVFHSVLYNLSQSQLWQVEQPGWQWGKSSNVLHSSNLILIQMPVREHACNAQTMALKGARRRAAKRAYEPIW